MRSLVGLATAALSVAIVGAQAPPRFRASVEAVRVDALVLQGDRPVAGLTTSNFELRDSGILQRVDAIDYQDEPLRVMFALDTSYSVNGQPLVHLRDAAAGVIELLSTRDRAAVLTFSSEIDLACGWTGDRALLARALDRRSGRGGTALHDAAFASLLMKDSEPGRALILLFSDGEDTASWLPGDAVVEAAQRTDAVVYAVGIQTPRDRTIAGFRFDISSGIQRPPASRSPIQVLQPLLPALARETGGKYVDAQRTNRLRDVFTRILHEFRTRYVLTYTPVGVEKGGWHPIEVTLKGARGKVTARRGYLR